MRRAPLLLLASVVLVSLLLPAPVIYASSPGLSTFFARAAVDDKAAYRWLSDGDLWPSCWSDDDNLYTANGDGKGFNLFAWTASDIVINRLSGTLPHLGGHVTAAGDAVGQIWTRNKRYNRKPTGMVCVDGAIYVAIQDLSLDFNDAPRASISKSTDHGVTWTWDTVAPMFDNYRFTTIMFLDYGKDNVNAIDDYVYAYGLDHNWRSSVTRVVPDPVDLYLARVPRTSIMNRAAWQFYTGTDSDGNPAWSDNIQAKVSILHDDRGYTGSRAHSFDNPDVLAQGGVVYNKPLNRYIYSTWTEFTFEFYEAPHPWGPWKHFLTKDYGIYPWSPTRYGGYGTTIPSKFISADGKVMWVQSNVCWCSDSGFSNYQFSLRRLEVEPADLAKQATS
ncbi:MAG: DUF4185 domain-containing protein [Anaerolineae bacterium]|nr:DUF4185 domain-containing protein [Anaerolineae bacterium]